MAPSLAATATVDTPVAPLLSTNLNPGFYKEQDAQSPASAALDHPHRQPQAYQGPAPLHQQHQPRGVSGSQAESQHYPVAGVYNPQTGLQSPFLSSQPHFPPQQPPENPYYASNPSPRSQHSAAGAYYSAEKPDPMAATATMQRPYPPIYTPQSNSPASVTSPQQHDPARPMYAQPAPQLSQSLYGYPQYPSMSQVQQHAGYGQHQSPSQPHQMASQPMLQYPPNPQQMPQQQVPGHHPSISSSPRLKSEGGQQYPPQQHARPPMMQSQHSTPAPSTASLQASQQASAPPTGSNAAPGPIPATTPLIVKQDGSGVQWIAFEYSRDRVKMEYTIRCDVESVDTNTLSQEFKSENCVYPRACVPKEQYKGNRLGYETECNQVGWALAELNSCLRGKRGLIQRAVDSWRNSNQDPRLRSRRVRRQAKMNSRTKLAASGAGQTAGTAGPGSAGLPGSTGTMPAPSTRPPGTISTAAQLHHHHGADVSPAPDNLAGPTYSTASQAYRQSPSTQHMGSPNDIRQAHVFPGYQAYANAPTSMGPSMAPSMQGGMHQLGRPGGNAAMASDDAGQKNDADIALFGDVPEDKRRKFILVEDTQKNARVRVKVTLDQIEMSEIPDSYRRKNSVFPRAYYPVQMQTSPESSKNDRFLEEGTEVDAGTPLRNKVSVSVPVINGEATVAVPGISQEKRGREEKINELGYRMAWGQGRVFSNRPIFLARALDAFRNKQRSTLLSAGQETSAIPSHLETRPGKRRWLERTNEINPPVEPPTTADSE